MAAYATGNKTDDGPGGSGLPHLAHAIVNGLFLMAFDSGLPVVEDKGPDAIPPTELSALEKRGYRGPGGI